jgi:FSR family fosmidomycin resistance protein-like MFS transporter
VLVAALAVELVDELADGTRAAALPLIRHDLGLSYGQLGLLASAPVLIGSLLELPLGVLAGHGRRRQRIILAGGAVFLAALLGTALAGSFAGLLISFIAFYPASGAFVSLTEASLMDADPDRQEQHMARWTLAGSVGAVLGPLLLTGILAVGGGWRDGYLLAAGAAAVAWLGLARWRLPGAAASGAVASDPGPPRLRQVPRQVAGALRRGGVLRSLALLEVSDLLLDVFTGFLAVYFVAVVHASPEQAALAVAVRYGAGIAGDLVVIRVLDRVSGRPVLRASAAAALLLYPAFLLVPGFPAKLAVLAVLTIATAPWYPVAQAQLYASLPGQSGTAVTLSSAAALAGGLGPLAVGFAAEQAGLAVTLGGLVLAPATVLYLAWRRTGASCG